MPSVNLYQIPQVVQTTQAGAVGVNSPTNKVDFDLSKNVHNEIEFLVKDIDQKPINLRNKTLIIYIVDQDKNTVMLQRELQTINEMRGHCRLTLAPQDTVAWETGYYQYSIMVQRADGTQILVHNNLGRSNGSYLHLLQGPLPKPTPAVETTNFYIQTWGIPLVEYKVTGSMLGAAQQDNRSGRHTGVIYTQGFTGKVMVQASLENTVPNSLTEWFNVDDAVLEFDNHTGLKHIEFAGNYMWVRFVIASAETNTGKVEKVVFKN